MTGSQVASRALFGANTYDGLMRRALALCYHAHGGSGLTVTRSEVMGMSVRELLWWERALDRRLKQNQRALEKAQEEARARAKR